MPLKINARQVGRIVVLDIEGAVRLGAEQLFTEHIRRLLTSGTRLLAVNLSRVSDLDSSGVGLFVRTLSQFKRAGGTCVFFAPTERVISVLKLVRLEHVLNLCDNEAAALARF